MMQKKHYIHQNSVKAGIVINQIDYNYSSALMYQSDKVVGYFLDKW